MLFLLLTSKYLALKFQVLLYPFTPPLRIGEMEGKNCSDLLNFLLQLEQLQNQPDTGQDWRIC